MIGWADDEALLDRFRRWLRDARAAADEPPGAASAAGDGDAPEVGLVTLLEEFTALRHELKLQTKSARGLQDQAEAMTRSLEQAIAQFRAVEPREAQAAFAAARPLAEALADLDEALDRGRAAIDQARRRAAEAIADPVAALEDAFARQSWLARRLGRRSHTRALEVVAAQARALNPGLLDSLAEGYGLIQARLRRAMAAEGIERVAALGAAVDPERMTVVDVVDDPDRPPGQVVEEVRRGYLWRGRVLRYAEVRATRTPPPPWPTDQPGREATDAGEQ